MARQNDSVDAAVRLPEEICWSSPANLSLTFAVSFLSVALIAFGR